MLQHSVGLLLLQPLSEDALHHLAVLSAESPAHITALGLLLLDRLLILEQFLSGGTYVAERILHGVFCSVVIIICL